jgi:hypothetical protein
VREVSASRLSTAELSQTANSRKEKKKGSKKAEKIKVASTGQVLTKSGTDISEVWLPLQNAGSDARILVRLQGLLLQPWFQTQICCRQDSCSAQYLPYFASLW